MAIITIIGAGMMGSAMSTPAADNGHTVRIVGTPLDRAIIRHAKASGEHLTLKRALPKSAAVFQPESLREALEGVQLVIGGVSSFGIDWFGNTALPLVPEDTPVLMITKGLSDTPDGSLRSFPDILTERIKRPVSLNAVGGPCTSYELADRRHSAVVFCGKSKNMLHRLKEWLTTDYYHISLSSDVMGVECAAALKNAYALGVTLAVGLWEAENAGMPDGASMAPAYNPQAALFTQSMREMRAILALTGSDERNIAYGAGDLYVTIFGGRTRMLGSFLGQGIPIHEALQRLPGVTLESAVIAERTVRAIRRLAERGQTEERLFPLLMHIGALLKGAHDQPIPWRSFETNE
jgi:glycerol-3-phosphate dehydrogenase (NAD(P)+)